jgi:Outer membrane protein beta-barrel domain
MKRWVLVFLATASLATPALAQDVAPGPSRAEVTIIPGGAMVFTQSKDASAPTFGSYELGGAFTYNVNRVFGLEGEVGSSVGVSQALEFGYPDNVRTPDMLSYNGNVVVSLPTRASVAPYATVGVGGLSLFSRSGFGVDGTETLFTTNVGGGVKWYAGRWGLRGDYRFVAVPSTDNVSAFGFGTQARYGHRIYGALILNVGR